MRHYQNPLYISHGTGDETSGLEQALSLARHNQAPLKVLIVSPEFPKDFPAYRERYEQALLERASASIAAAQSALGLDDEAVSVSVELVSDNTPVITIIRRVISDGHDLVIKEAEPRDQAGGFKSIDMHLLRKCPSAVWLCRPLRQAKKLIQIAVAIDPGAHEPAAEALSKRMLELSQSLEKKYGGDLHIVSCWDYEFESFLRGNLWAEIPDSAIEDVVMRTRGEHRLALDKLISDSGISETAQIHHLRGKPSELIPEFVSKKNIDILVMGTLARTGIPGFLIGNTAENTVQKLSCSLLALKPKGYVSPIKA